ncbi:MAG: sigma factor [bacterium]
MGPRILGYLAKISPDEATALEAFSLCCEDLWRGLPGFRGDSTLRTWAYRLARSAAARVARRQARDARLLTPLSPDAERIVEAVRSTTLPYLRTTEKDRLARMRGALSPSTPRSWCSGSTGAWRGRTWPSSSARPLEAALRKRFERIKDRLRALMAADAAAGG